MLFKRNGGKSKASGSDHSFPAEIVPVTVIIKAKAVHWYRDQLPLFEATWVALAIHILALPLFWFAGWALPWPESPEIMTVIEINLENWPNEAVPEKVTDIHKADLYKHDK